MQLSMSAQVARRDSGRLQRAARVRPDASAEFRKVLAKQFLSEFLFSSLVSASFPWRLTAFLLTSASPLRSAFPLALPKTLLLLLSLPSASASASAKAKQISACAAKLSFSRSDSVIPLAQVSRSVSLSALGLVKLLFFACASPLSVSRSDSAIRQEMLMRTRALLGIARASLSPHRSVARGRVCR